MSGAGCVAIRGTKMKRMFACVYTIMLTLLCAGEVDAANGISIELNKVEPNNGLCRVYLVISNMSENSFSEFELDIVMFGTDGIISKRLAVNLAPLRPNKTAVSLFDIPDLGCADIGRVLINDVISCQDNDGERADCIDLIDASSQSSISMVK